MKLFFRGKNNGVMIEHCRTNISMPIIYMIARKPFHTSMWYFSEDIQFYCQFMTHFCSVFPFVDVHVSKACLERLLKIYL